MDSHGVVYLPSLMKIGTDIEAILRFRLRNLKGRDVSITNVKGIGASH
jgi:hypothetical protein